MKDKKTPVWKIGVFIISLLFIVFMWSKKGIAQSLETMPQEQVLPFIVTTIAVGLLKVGVIAGAVFLIKWIIGKIKNKKQ